MLKNYPLALSYIECQQAVGQICPPSRHVKLPLAGCRAANCKPESNHASFSMASVSGNSMTRTRDLWPIGVSAHFDAGPEPIELAARHDSDENSDGLSVS